MAEKNPKLAETPEFQAAVSEAVEKAMAKFAGELAALRKDAGTASEGDDEPWMRRLALTMAEIADQGTHRKRVAPEILAKRAAAREKMGERILRARAKRERPEYRLINETYINERLIKPFTTDPATKRPLAVEIYFDGVPNEAMRPLNEPAREIYALFAESIGGRTDAVPTADNRPLWVTPGGLTVKGATSGQRRVVSGLGDPLPDTGAAEPSPFSDELAVKSANDPSAEFVHVLGTVAPPARQNYQGERR